MKGWVCIYNNTKSKIITSIHRNFFGDHPLSILIGGIHPMNAQETSYAVRENNELEGSVQELPSQYVTPIMCVASVPVVWTVRGVSEEARRRSKIAALMTSLPIGEFVDRALLDAVQGGIEAMRGRATATPKGKEGKIWTIRGVQPETRRRSRIAALKLGWTVGEFVDRALLDATERLPAESAYPLKQTA